MHPQEEDEHDDEEMGVAETYADYWPAKCMDKFYIFSSKIFLSHPFRYQ